MGSLGANSGQYADLVQKINQKPDSTLWRNFMIERDDRYIGKSQVERALEKEIATPKDYHVGSIESMSIDTAPDKNGYATVYAKYTLVNDELTGGVDLGTGQRMRKKRSKQDSGTFKIKIMK